MQQRCWTPGGIHLHQQSQLQHEQQSMQAASGKEGVREYLGRCQVDVFKMVGPPRAHRNPRQFQQLSLRICVCKRTPKFCYKKVMELRNFRPVVKDNLGIKLLSKDVKSKKKKKKSIQTVMSLMSFYTRVQILQVKESCQILLDFIKMYDIVTY